MFFSNYAVKDTFLRRGKQTLMLFLEHCQKRRYPEPQPTYLQTQQSGKASELTSVSIRKRFELHVQPWFLAKGMKHSTARNSNWQSCQQQNHWPGWTLRTLRLLSSFRHRMSHTVKVITHHTANFTSTFNPFKSEELLSSKLSLMSCNINKKVI